MIISVLPRNAIQERQVKGTCIINFIQIKKKTNKKKNKKKKKKQQNKCVNQINSFHVC